MKKFFAIFAAAAALVACSKVDIPAPDTDVQDNAITDFTFDITVEDLLADPETKAVKKSWATGDKINIWFNGNYQQTPDLVMTYSASTGKWTYALNNSFTPQNGQKIVALYVANNSLGSYGYSSSGSGSSAFGEFSISGTRDGSTYYRNYLAAGCSRTYTYSSNSVRANLTGWRFSTQVQVVISGLDTSKYGYYTLSCDHLLSLKGVRVRADGYAVSSGFSAGTPVLGVSNEDGVAFCFWCPNTTSSADYKFTLTRYTTNSAKAKVMWTRTYTASSKTVADNTAKCQSIKIDESKFSHTGTTSVTDIAAAENNRTDCGWVQLWAGGPKFAKYNVAATIDDNYTSAPNNNNRFHNPYVGGLYAFGNGSINGRASGGKWGESYSVELHDTATYLWGSNWRTPTMEEMEDLMKNCTVVWSSGVGSGRLEGLSITGKGSYINEWIYLPAGGWYDYSSDDVIDKGTKAKYWTSQKSYVGYYYQFTAFRDSGTVNGACTSISNPRFGYAVRAVVND